ncbi:MAG: InlB B-repeat-containing protein [Clostridia bacterium]|nr:InlB B-repeat-containing protein [Clostridia bacterium]
MLSMVGCSKNNENLDEKSLITQPPDVNDESDTDDKKPMENGNENSNEGDKDPVNDPKKDILRLEVSSRVKNRSDSSTWKIVSTGESAKDDVWSYKKNTGISADNARLTVSTNGATSMSFDVLVNFATDGEFQLQLEGGASFISVNDKDGNKIEPAGDPAMPYVMLQEGNEYSIKLDFSGTAGFAGLRVWHAKAVDLTYSDISFDHIGGAENTFFRQIVCKSQETLGYFAWPSVERLEGDRLIAVCSGYRQGHVDPYGKVVGWISDDNGLTWGEPFEIADTVLDDRDAGVIYWNGKIFVTWFTAPNRNYSSEAQWADWCAKVTPEMEAKHLGANMVVSEDGGKTWSAPQLIDVFAPHGMIQSPDGKLVYVGYSDYDQSLGAFTKIGMITSTDGVTWSEVKVIADAEQKNRYGFHEPHAVYAEDGTLIVQLRTSRGIYQCELYPDSDEFTDFKLISRATETPPQLLKLSSGALLLTYGYRGTNCGVRARVSYDNGINWSKEILITAEAFEWDMGYTDTVELDDGRLLTVYYQKEKVSDRHTGIMEVIWELPEKPSGVQTITFDSMGGSDIDAVSGEFGTVVSTPTDPTREGYIFMGWYRDNACTETYTVNLFTETLTVYAKWISENPLPEAHSQTYLRPATDSEISAAGYGGDGDVYLYTKPVGGGGSFGGNAEMWIDVSQHKNKTLTFSFYLKEWNTADEMILEISGVSNGSFVFDELMLVKSSDKTPVSFTKGQNGYHLTAEKGVWYTATIEIDNSERASIFCWFNRGMELLIADVGIVE